MKDNHMKQHLSIITGGLIAFCLPLQTQAQVLQPPPDQNSSVSTQANFGPKAVWSDITEVKITNFQGQPLGRIQDLTLDLTNGRIVEVLVVYDQHFRMGGKTVAVPPGALIPDEKNKVYEINMSEEVFKDAPTFDMSKWADSTSTDRVAAAYRYFGQTPNFLVAGEASGATTPAGRPLTNLGIVERMSKINNMDVNNLNGVLLGHVESLSLDMANGRIINASITTRLDADARLRFSTEIPATLLSFNAKRDHLLLDVTKVEYKEEPHVIFEFGAAGQVVSSREEAATGPATGMALVQGTSFRDVNTTAKIYQAMQDDKLDTFGVEVATLDGRVTLRGSVDNQGVKDGIGKDAITVVRLDNVDNQINVKPNGLFPASQDSVKESTPPAQSSL
jgi:sporulation protein YlmC with PRC-barrel domain